MDMILKTTGLCKNFKGQMAVNNVYVLRPPPWADHSVGLCAYRSQLNGLSNSNKKTKCFLKSFFGFYLFVF